MANLEPLIERVAIAMWCEDTFGKPEQWKRDASETTKEVYRRSAKAAIQAVREWDRESGA